MRKAGIQPSPILKCAESSYENETHALAANTLLEVERRAYLDSGTYYFPSIQVNNKTYHGNFDAESVMSYICTSFDRRSYPNACSTDSHEIPKPHHHTSPKHDDDDFPLSEEQVLLIAVIAIATISLILLIYRRCLKRDMNRQMQDQVGVTVDHYIALAES
jgi:hypothetical protein